MSGAIFGWTGSLFAEFAGKTAIAHASTIVAAGAASGTVGHFANVRRDVAVGSFPALMAMTSSAGEQSVTAT